MHIDVYNIRGLDHKDLLRAIIFELMTHPEIFDILDKYEISLIGTSFRDIETEYAKISDMRSNPGLYLTKNSSFGDFYYPIISQFCFLNGVEDLDNLYRVEIRLMIA